MVQAVFCGLRPTLNPKPQSSGIPLVPENNPNPKPQPVVQKGQGAVCRVVRLLELWVPPPEGTLKGHFWDFRDLFVWVCQVKRVIGLKLEPSLRLFLEFESGCGLSAEELQQGCGRGASF